MNNRVSADLVKQTVLTLSRNIKLLSHTPIIRNVNIKIAITKHLAQFVK